MIVNCSPVVLLVNSLVVFNMGQALQRLVPHGELPGVLCTRNVKVACTSKSLRFFRRLKAISGGELKIALRRASQKIQAQMICHHQWNRLFFSSTVATQQTTFPRFVYCVATVEENSSIFRFLIHHHLAAHFRSAGHSEANLSVYVIGRCDS